MKMNCDPEFLKQILRDYLYRTKDDWNYITPVDFYNNYYQTNKDYFLVDLRHPQDFENFHVSGAQNIYWLNILDEHNLKKLPKNKQIFLICYVGHTSSQALVLLKILGYNVTAIKFGFGKSPVFGVPIAGWLNYNYPVI